MSDHPIIPAVHRNLCASDFSEERAGHGGDHVADVLALDLHLHEVLGLVFLHRHPVAVSALLQGFGCPEFGIEDGIWMHNVHAHFVWGEFQGSDAAELGEGGLAA